MGGDGRGKVPIFALIYESTSFGRAAAEEIFSESFGTCKRLYADKSAYKRLHAHTTQYAHTVCRKAPFHALTRPKSNTLEAEALPYITSHASFVHLVSTAVRSSDFGPIHVPHGCVRRHSFMHTAVPRFSPRKRSAFRMPADAPSRRQLRHLPRASPRKPTSKLL